MTIKDVRNAWVKFWGSPGRVSAGVVMLALAVGSVVSWQHYRQTTHDTFLTYQESGQIDYQVHLSPNDYFPGRLAAGREYISALVDGITAHLRYQLTVPEGQASPTYTYRLVTQTSLTDSREGRVIYQDEHQLAQRTLTAAGGRVTIDESVGLDFPTANATASALIEDYGLSSSVDSQLAVLLTVTPGPSETGESWPERTFSLRVPLHQTTFGIETDSPLTGSESQLVITAQPARGWLTVSLWCWLGIIALGAWLVVSYERHLSPADRYQRQLRRIKREFGAVIQEVDDDYPVAGQLLSVKNFTDLLELQETLHEPILLSHNRSHTASRFFILTDRHLTYQYWLVTPGTPVPKK